MNEMSGGHPLTPPPLTRRCFTEIYISFDGRRFWARWRNYCLITR